ncbi:ribonuclease P protein component [Actinocatenispora sera]|uniref:ribonuclease P protein component n=1 Tax=Actinocatenispora sera TaxID=390989 RepID=UPI0033FC5C0A
MLPPAARLRRRAEFAATTRGGRRAARGALVVHLAPPQPGTNQDTPPSGPRFGFAVSRAVGNAVIRNKVRRRLRHLARERLDQLPAGTTVLVRALPAAADRTFQQLGRDLDAALAAAAAPRGTQRRKAPRSGETS